MQDDTLYIMCLPNHQKSQLVRGKSSYAGAVNDFAANKKDKESAAKKTSISAEYNNLIPQYSFAIPVTETIKPNNGLLCPLHTVASSTPEHPPKAYC